MPDQASVGADHLFVNSRMSVDDTVLYTGLIRLMLADCRQVLDVGCGRGANADYSSWAPLFQLRGSGRTVLGIDVDPAAADNPYLDEFRILGADGSWPVESDSVDLVVSDWTLEHVEDPAVYVSELCRCLRVGGAFVARSVGRRSALALVSRAIPNRLHASIVARWQPERFERDVFPTFYRMNTRRDLDALFAGRFAYTFAGRPSFENYLRARRPRTAKTALAVERRLPDGLQSAFVVCARLLSKDGQ